MSVDLLEIRTAQELVRFGWRTSDVEERKQISRFVHMEAGVHMTATTTRTSPYHVTPIRHVREDAVCLDVRSWIINFYTI